MYEIRDIKKGVSNPRLIRGEVRKLCGQINSKIHSRFYNEGVRVVSKDWDNLLILDGCRYDMFSEVNTLPGSEGSVISASSTSEEFVQKNFQGNTLHDTVGITANPYYGRIDPAVFHDVRGMLSEWDNELETVHPSVMVDAVQSASEQYPNKRLLVHFMQPHIPFIGPKGRELNHRGYSPSSSIDEPGIWDILQYGYIGHNVTRDEVLEAYWDNLDFVLEFVEKLYKSLDGKTVISADHGNMIGERMTPIPARIYGHPAGLRDRGLVKVPWHTLPYDSRKRVISEPPVSNSSELEDEALEEKLAALGYR